MRYVAAHDPEKGWAVVDVKLSRTASAYTPDKTKAEAEAKRLNEQDDLAEIVRENQTS